MPTRSPVTIAEPSQSVNSFETLPRRYSVRSADAIDTMRTKSALRPKDQTPHSAAGRRAMATRNIALSVLRLPWI